MIIQITKEEYHLKEQHSVTALSKSKKLQSEKELSVLKSKI